VICGLAFNETRAIEGTGMFPVCEPKTLVIRTSSKVDNQSAENKTSNEDELDDGEDKFGFPEVPDTKNIDETDKETEDHSIASLVLMIIVPVSDKDGCSRDLYGDSDSL
jgi:hypothetical protein